MPFLLMPLGSAGDVFPLVGLGRELRRRGHRVVMVVNEYFEEVVRQAELEYVELDGTDSFDQITQDPDLWHPRRAFGAIVKHGIAPTLRTQFETIQAVTGSQDGFQLVASCLAMGARLAQEKLNLPLATIHLQPAALWSRFESPALPGPPMQFWQGPSWLKQLLFRTGEHLVINRAVLPILNPYRAELGLPPVRRVTDWWHSTELVIGMFPSWFAAPQPDWPPQTVLTDFPLWESDVAGKPDDGLQDFLKQHDPPIVFLPGSAMRHGQTFFQTAVETCQHLQRPGILLTSFPETVPPALPDSVLHVPFVPLEWLLPHCAALVHHGGIGTTSQALRAGTPQLIMPMAHDQPDNAARIKRLGVGDYLLPKRFQVAALARKLKLLTEGAEVAEACDKVRQRMVSGNGLQQAADAVEAMKR